jgi:hypothetical protein
MVADDEVGRRVLDLRMEANDAGAGTVRAYLTVLLSAVWRERDEFDGKRPFGNSSWEYELYQPLAEAGLIAAERDEDGILVPLDRDAGDRLVEAAIRRLGSP